MKTINIDKILHGKYSNIIQMLETHICSENIENLFVYLSKTGIYSDIQAILEVLFRHFNSQYKIKISKILYCLLKTYSNAESVNTTKVDILFSKYTDLNDENSQENSDTQKIFDMYFSLYNGIFVKKIEMALLYHRITSDRLSIFLFLIKNSKIDYYFDIGKYPIKSISDIQILHEILKCIKERNPIEMLKIGKTFNNIMKNTNIRMVGINSNRMINNIISNTLGSNHVSNNNLYCFSWKSLFLILHISCNTLLNHKYEIMINVYDIMDNRVYEDSKYLSVTILDQICQMNIDISKLKVRYLDQLLFIVNKLRQKDGDLAEKYAINNINEDMCIFDIIEQLNVNIKLMDKLLLRRMYIISLGKHSFKSGCLCAGFNIANINVLKEFLEGKEKIKIDCILNIKLDPNYFDKNEIEKVMKYSVRVFPKEYFLSNVFPNSRASFFLREHPEYLSDNDKLLEMKNIFRKTENFEIAELIISQENLKLFFTTLGQDEIKLIYERLKYMIPDNLKIVYLYFLWNWKYGNNLETVNSIYADQIIDPNNNYLIDYKIIFKHFLSKDFLRYLLLKGYNVLGFYNEIIDHIKNLECDEYILFTGYNFDSRNEFISDNFVSSKHDSVMVSLENVLESHLSNNRNLTDNIYCDFLLLYNIIRLANYKTVDFLRQESRLRSYIGKKFENDTICIKNVESYAQLFGCNSCYCERALLEFYDLKEKSIGLNFSRFKLIDLVLRYYLIDTILINRYINPTYLSHEALENCVRSIIENISGYTKLKEFKYEMIHGFDINNKKVPVDKVEDKNSEESGVSITFSDEKQTESLFITLLNHIFECDTNLIINNRSNLLFDELECIRIINDDGLFNLKELREIRYNIYSPLINRLANICSVKIQNLYNLSKGDNSKISDKVIFNSITSFLNPFINCYWLILINSLKKVSTIQIITSVEEYIMKTLDDNVGIFKEDLTNMFQNLSLGENTEINILIQLRKYLSICTVNECTEFSLIFPNLFLKINELNITLPRNFELIKNYVKEMANVKIENVNIGFGEKNRFYSLCMIYVVDEIQIKTSVDVPHNYPLSPAEIGHFEIGIYYCPESIERKANLFLKMKSILKSSGKFIEILMMWKSLIEFNISESSKCLICFSVVAPIYGILHGFKCITCANVFHIC